MEGLVKMMITLMMIFSIWYRGSCDDDGDVGDDDDDDDDDDEDDDNDDDKTTDLQRRPER